MEITLKTFTLTQSVDKTRTKLTLESQDGQSVDVIMPSEHFQNFLFQLVEIGTKLKIEKVLPDNDPEIETPSREHALLIAKNIDIARWEAGAVALQIQTTDGAALQIGLTPKMVEFLKYALSAPLS